MKNGLANYLKIKADYYTISTTTATNINNNKIRKKSNNIANSTATAKTTTVRCPNVILSGLGFLFLNKIGKFSFFVLNKMIF